MHLSDGAGEEVLRQLAETPETRDIPVLVLGADSPAAQTERLGKARARAYLTSPLDVRKFLILLGELIQESNARGTIGLR